MSFEKSRTWAEIHLSVFENNIKVIKNHIGEKVKLMAVVKANAYGHGAKMVAKTAVLSGADYLGVACIEEGKQIREVVKETPILILSCADPMRAEDLLSYDLMPTVFSLDYAKTLNEAAAKCEKKITVHLKIDTGMTRLGFDWHNPKTLKEIEEISKMSHLEIEGIYTHFADADNEKDADYTAMQYQRLVGVIEALKKVGIHIPIKHACNSAGTIVHPEMHLDMVRCGIILYGYYPAPFLQELLPGIHPVMELKSRIQQIRSIEKGITVSYGRTHLSKSEETLVVVPAGYADGVRRLLSNRGHVLIHGNRVPLVGRICMDQMMAKLPSHPKVKPGDIAVLMGQSGNEAIWADEIAKSLETISYEVLCDVGERVPRVFDQEGTILAHSG